MDGMLKSVLVIMLNVLGFALMTGMVGLIAYEIFQEVRGSSGALHDRYHE